MYNKEQLEMMEPIQLMEIAQSMDIKVTPESNKEDVIYDILDKAAVEMASNSQTEKPKRKYTRKAKTETEEKDKAEEKPKRKYTRKAKTTENEDNAEQKQEEKKEQPAKKKKTAQKSTEAEEKANELKAQDAPAELTEKESDTVKTKKAEIANDVPEANKRQAETPDTDASGTPNEEMLQQLQQKMKQHNKDEKTLQDEAQEKEFPVWEGDPADGTDFIVVTDLPIEDNAALPTLDIFDRPTAMEYKSPVAPIGMQKGKAATPFRNKNEQAYDFGDFIKGNGVLEIVQDGYGFLRSSDYNYLSSPDDIYVSQQQVKKYSLKTGDVVECTVRPPHESDKYFLMSTVISINGRNPAEVRDRVSFEHLTPLFPEEKFNLTGDPRTTNPSTRIVDLFAPIGKGQRALIVAQPKTGKTILMKDIANAIAANHPEAYIMMLLIDERPEEVTDMSRTVNAEVIASTFDEPAERHVKIAGIVLEKAKRMVECGHDVVIFLDSITRLARAYNTVSPASGKVLTGGVDANALQKPKRFFGAARKIEGGGSLTIIATALVDTGSKMDEVIFEEFKGTGNSEIQLDRMLSNKRIFPALNLVQSSTRRDDLLQDQTTLNRMWIVRKFIAEMNPIEAMDTLRDRIMHSKSNEEFLISMNS